MVHHRPPKRWVYLSIFLPLSIFLVLQWAFFLSLSFSLTFFFDVSLPSGGGVSHCLHRLITITCAVITKNKPTMVNSKTPRPLLPPPPPPAPPLHSQAPPKTPVRVPLPAVITPSAVPSSDCPWAQTNRNAHQTPLTKKEITNRKAKKKT